jgi:outer membrane protein assembly factor BamD (BamD/ComL family)
LLEGYLWVYQLYNQDSRQYSKALYHCSQIFAELGMRDRAEKLTEILKSKYPESPFTKQLKS